MEDNKYSPHPEERIAFSKAKASEGGSGQKRAKRQSRIKKHGL